MYSTTLCYIQRGTQYLMLHRVKKKNDINHDKWIGIGGKLEEGESPEDGLLREVREETGLTLTRWRYRGIVTFVAETDSQYMHLFTADGYTGQLTDCDEGDLEWIERTTLRSLPIWEGDKIFLRLLEENAPFFSLKLVYQGDWLVDTALNGRPMEQADLGPKEKEPLLISACLLGTACRYDGASKAVAGLERLAARYQLIPVCPEQLGGLPTPRPPAERRLDRVMTRLGGDVTEAYARGAREALHLAKKLGCTKALLKERSPSCGRGTIYDGSFSGRLISGSGMTAQLLEEQGIAVWGESSWEALL